MNIRIEQVSPISSQTGIGLSVGDITLGVAIVRAISMEEGETLVDYAKEGGLSLAHSLRQVEGTVISGDALAGVAIEFDEESLEKARNYVLIAVDKDKNTSIIGTAKDITEVFSLPEEDAEMLDKYLPVLADSRNLSVVKYFDPDRNEECMMFTPNYDAEIMEHYINGEIEEAKQKEVSIQRNPQFQVELSTHNFIKMMLIAVVKTGQDRYNKIYRDDKIEEAAKLLSGITYWDDGKLYTPSVADINAYTNEMKKDIRI